MEVSEVQKSMVIAFATGKGGAGKSTLVRNLSAYWLLQKRHVGILDTDPKSRVYRRHQKDGPMKAIPVIAEANHLKVNAALKKLQKQCDLILVDTAGFDNKTNVMVCSLADLVVIPLRPAPDDFDDAIEMHKLISELNQTEERKNKPVQNVFVLTQVKARTLISKMVVKDFKRAGLRLLKSEIQERVDYPEASIDGLGVCFHKPNSKASYDVRLLAKELEKVGEFYR